MALASAYYTPLSGTATAIKFSCVTARAVAQPFLLRAEIKISSIKTDGNILPLVARDWFCRGMVNQSAK
jgi:hypothetical protein